MIGISITLAFHLLRSHPHCAAVPPAMPGPDLSPRTATVSRPFTDEEREAIRRKLRVSRRVMNELTREKSRDERNPG